MLRSVLREKIEPIIFIVMCAVLMSHPFERQLENSGLAAGDVRMLSRIVTFVFLGLLLMFSLRHWQAMLKLIPRNALLVVFVGLALLSTVWSMAPSLTLLTAVIFAAFTVVGWYMAVRFSLQEYTSILTAGLGVIVLLNLLAVLLLGDQVISNPGNRYVFGHWQGLYRNENTLGLLGSLSALLFWMQFHLSAGKKQWGYLALFGVALTSLLFSASKASLGVFLIAWIAFEMLRIGLVNRFKVNWRLILLDMMVIGVIVLFQAGVTNVKKPGISDAPPPDNSCEGIELSPLETSLDGLLTGRLTIWKASTAELNQQPLLGYGYRGYWSQQDPIAAFCNNPIYTVLFTHNDYLDAALALGYVGGLIFVLFVLQTGVRAVRYALKKQTLLGLWPIITFAWFVGTAMLEIILVYRRIHWAIFVTVAIVVSMNALPDRQKNDVSVIEP